MPTQDEWFEAVVDSYLRPPVVVNGKALPGFPPDQVQINTTGQAGAATLKEAFVFYCDCVDTFRALGAPLQARHRLLDFGVGWGRIARFFLRDLPLGNIHGIDVSADAIQTCRQTFGNDNFEVTSPYPPTKYPDGTFDAIVGYSVFSHLSEDACRQWMAEFHRILAPGGMLALTTRGRPFFDYCESLAGKGHAGYLGALSTLFDDFRAARARYDRGEFVHSNKEGVSGGGAMTSAFYGETFIPQAYARRAYSEQFAFEKFLFDPPRQSHPILFFRKRPLGSQVSARQTV
jgi:SAM-dependent methyltransferase